MSKLTPKFRSVDFSEITITELMIPAYANFGGKIHGGIILSLMDKAAYTCSAKHAGGYCVTVSMNATEFLSPVEVGELVHLTASVNYVGNSSIVVGIKVKSEDITTGEVKHTNSSYFTMVALDDQRKPRKIQGLILESKEDARRFMEAMKRKELLAQYKAEWNDATSSIQIENQLSKLDTENCMVIDF